MKRLPLVLASLSLWLGSAYGQGIPVTPAGTSSNTAGAVQGVTGGIPVPVSGTFTATLGGFTPSASGARMTQLSVTTSDSSGTLPNGTVVVVSNTGTTNPMYCNVNGVAATTSDQLIPISSWFAFTIPSGVTTLHCIATGGSTTADGVGGAGLPTGAGGGGGSGGGGSATTPFATGGTYLNIPSVTSTSANSALPAGTNVVLYNYGYYRIIYKLSTSGSTVVTSATADGIVQPGATQEIAVGSNTNIAYATTVASGTAALQIIGGTGIWIGTNQNYGNLGFTNITGPSQAALVGGIDNGGLLQQLQSTAPGTSATNFALAVQGVTGGVTLPVNVGSMGGSSISSTAVSAIGTAGTGNVPNVNAYIVGGGGSGGTSSSFGSAFPATGTAIGLTNGTNMVAWSATSNYGTAPSAIAVPALNADVTNVNSNGQATMANSSPVVIASNQSAVAGNITQIAGSASGVTTWGTAPTGASVVNANVNCLSGCGGSGGTSASDNSSFTAGTSSITPIGGAVGLTALTSGHAGAVAMDTGRNLFVNAAEWDGTALGAPSNYGTSPGAVAVPGVNAFVTNTVGANTAQVNGVTVLTGAGATGTGAQRVTVSQDTTTVAGAAPLTTGIFVTGPSAAALATSANQPTNSTQGAATSGQTGNLAMGVATTSAPTDTNGDSWALSLTTGGGLRSDKTSVGGTALSAAVSAYGTAPTGTEVEGVNAYVTNTNPNGQATSANSAPVVLPAAQVTTDPCSLNTKSNATVSQTSSGTLVTGTSGKKNYICSISLVASAAAEVSLVEYSGTCTGGTAYADWGSTTAASGFPFAANSGIAMGSGSGTVISGAGNSNSGYNVCLLQSGSATVVAQVTYVQQ